MYMDYDNLYVTVKADKLDEVTACYGALGWERVEVKEHKIYADELDLAFRRPHKIDNKDARQLMQVYLDEALNGLAKLRLNFYPKSTAFSVIFSLLSAGAIAAGLCLVFILGGLWTVAGAAIAGAGGLLAVFTLVASIISFKREKASNLKLERRLKKTVELVGEAAAVLGGESDEG